MINKKVISDIVSKYSLGNNIEKVKWAVTDNKLTINFINGSKNLTGYVEYREDVGLKEGNYGIYNTSTLIKCLNILEGDILIDSPYNKSDGYYSAFNLADTNYNITFKLSDPAVTPAVPELLFDDESFKVSFSINDEFITRFVKSKDALGEDVFTIKTREGFTGEELVFTIGTDITNTVEFIVENATINESFEEIIFDSNLFKEILKANKNYHSGEIRINPKGVLDIHLHCGGPLYTGYILVRNENNN